MNSSKHLAGVKVGRAGYNRGCRCVDCATAQREYKRQYRSRSTTVPAVPGPYVVGPVEVAVVARLDELLEDVPGGQVWCELAVLNARMLDSLAARNVSVGVTSLQSSLALCLDRLQPPKDQGEVVGGGDFSTKAKRDAWAADL